MQTQTPEFEFIARLAARPGAAAEVIGDDAAVLPAGDGASLLLATDTILEATHFLRESLPAAGPLAGLPAIGHKALAVNLSDIAAMGGTATACTLALSAGRGWSSRDLDAICEGLLATAQEFGCPLVGGDTTSWNGPLALTVTVLGRVDEPLLRAGGRAGDVLVATGPLGGSLKCGRHLTFTPRLREIELLRRHLTPTAAIDLSDGLASDLAHLAAASGCGAIVDHVPRHEGVTLEAALADGEDFELLLALNPDEAADLFAGREMIETPVPLHRIGRLTADSEVRLRVAGRDELLPPTGYSHPFSRD